MKRTTYTAEQRAQVVAAWKAGASLNAIVRAQGIPKSTVREWVKGVERIAVAPKTTQGAEEGETSALNIDAMAWRLVGGSFDALDAVHRLAQDPDWLRRQNAADVAIFFGVISDKLIRVLEAVRPADTGSDALEV